MRNLFLPAAIGFGAIGFGAIGFGLTLLSIPAKAGGDAQPAALSELCAEAAARLKEITPTPPVDPNAVIVLNYKYRFCPENLTVKAGTKVQWINVEKRANHSVWLKEAGIPETERFFPGEGWSYTFAKPGDYPYICGPHGVDEKMTGSLTVTP